MIPDQIRNTQSWGSAVPGKHPTLRYGCYVITGNPLGSWSPSSDNKNKCLVCIQYDSGSKSGIRRAGALRSQGSILRSTADAMSLSAIRWEVEAPAPTLGSWRPAPIKKNGVV